MVDALLVLLLVICLLSRRAPSLAMLTFAALAWRVLPSPANEAVAGVTLIVASAAAKRCMGSDGRPR